MAVADIELIDEETIGVRFPFDPNLVSQIRSLNSRRWNPAGKRWEIHLAHLAEVMRIFYMHPKDVPAEVIDLYRDRWIRNQLRVVLGNTVSRLSGSNVPVGRIDEAISFPVSGHQYSLKFIEGAWDGRRHLFDRRDLSFPSGLLGVVTEILDKEKIAYELQDRRRTSSASLKVKARGLDLRPYQKEAVRAAVRERRGVLEMATGAGKTMVAAKIVARLKRPALFFVHTKDLLYQAQRQLGEYLGLEIGRVGDGGINLMPVTVAMIQTAIRAFGGTYGESLDEDAAEDDATDPGKRSAELAQHIRSTPVVFFDECHHLPADTFYAVAMETEAADCRYGLSATPYRADRHDMMLEAALGPKIFQANSSRLIDLGYLVAPTIRVVPVPGPRGRRGHRDYHGVYRKRIVDNKARHEQIAQEAARLNKAGKSALILVKEVRHGEQLLEVVKGARFIQGADSAKVRREALADLESKKLMALIATTLADEGLDVPTLDAVILAGGGRSETKALQRVGRALRPAEGKQSAEIVDFFDQAPYLIDHSRKRLEIFRTEPRFKVDDSGLDP
jgi:superfamily II DNA or RNA helicase